MAWSALCARLSASARVLLAVLDAVRHLVEVVGQLAQVGGRQARQRRNAGIELAAGDAPGRGPHRIERPGQALGEDPAQHRRRGDTAEHEDEGDALHVLGPGDELLVGLGHHHAPAGLRHFGVAGDDLRLQRGRIKGGDAALLADHPLDRIEQGDVLDCRAPGVDRMGDDAAALVDDRRITLRAEGDRGLELDEIVGAQRGQRDPVFAEPLHQEDRRLSAAVRHDRAEGDPVIGHRQQAGDGRAVEAFAGHRVGPDVGEHAVLVVENAELTQPYAMRDQRHRAGGRVLGIERGEIGEGAFDVERVALQQRRRLVGEQEMLLPHRIDFLMQGGALDPKPKDENRNRGDQREGDGEDISELDFQGGIRNRELYRNGQVERKCLKRKERLSRICRG